MMIDPKTTQTFLGEQAPKSRRVWSKPRVVMRETLEAVAADCSIPGGKSDPTCTIGFS